ncbi:MAG: hypothetical protein RIG63_07070 [Coleofasciculus chthonoplastes F3-SA18-01]
MARLYNGAERPNRCVYCYKSPKAATRAIRGAALITILSVSGIF